MKLIAKKKKIYPVSSGFDRYLREYSRGCRLQVEYDDLLRYEDAMTLYDNNGDDTFWATVSFGPSDRNEIQHGLLEIYSFLRADGDTSITSHLVVDRVDLCLYGNTKPFRIRITNSLNDNFDYFYIKEADSSRIFGLELEHILSPNRIGFFYFRRTLVEEHIYGVPGDMFLRRYLLDPHLNKVRLAKEFVKFNERCFLRLLGDMHAANFVVDVTIDFEENFYRLRAIDFDQQSYEGKRQVYVPRLFKENKDFVSIVSEILSSESIAQYQLEERSLIFKRMELSRFRLGKLLSVLKHEPLAPASHLQALGEGLAGFYEDNEFLSCASMSDIVAKSLGTLES